MIAQYKARSVKGGVYSITCTETGKIFLDCVLDLQGSQNRFYFSVKTAACMQMKLQADWIKYTASGFEFNILEEIEIKEGQSKKEFLADIKFFKEMWLDKLVGKEVY